MRVCYNCKEVMSDDQIFCHKCGVRYVEPPQIPGPYIIPNPRHKKSHAGKIAAISAISIVAVLIVGVLFYVGVSQLFGSKQDFVLYNNTGVSIHYLYLSPIDSNDWEENIIDGSILYDGDSLPVTFTNDYDDVRYWDMRIGDSSGNCVDWTTIDLYTVKSIELYVDYDGNICADLK